MEEVKQNEELVTPNYKKYILVMIIISLIIIGGFFIPIICKEPVSIPFSSPFSSVNEELTQINIYCVYSLILNLISIIIILLFILTLICYLIILKNNFKQSSKQGLLCLLPPYVIYWAFKNYQEKISKFFIFNLFGSILLLIIGIFFNYFTYSPSAKPVIYLYPETTTQVKVQLDYQGELIADYPDYNEDIKGWEVLAYPDGKLINLADKQEYSYLFWEGMPSKPSNWNLSQGFIVKGEDTRKFLQTVLSKMGLTPKEYNEFIVYWYPLMKDNKYNLIHFAEEEYTKTAPLTITPPPDSILRVFMAFKALDKPINIKEQKIKPFARTGFSVVEWGGTEIN